MGRITAIDAAGPMFESAHDDARLSPDDANFVQAFHVNAATLTFGGFGLYTRVGHIDCKNFLTFEKKDSFTRNEFSCFIGR